MAHPSTFLRCIGVVSMSLRQVLVVSAMAFAFTSPSFSQSRPDPAQVKAQAAQTKPDPAQVRAQVAQRKADTAQAESGTSPKAMTRLDISTVAGASDALATTDAALTRINDARANAGAIQSRAQATAQNAQQAAQQAKQASSAAK
jgi:flagellin-like hook-associated protein FlgL